MEVIILNGNIAVNVEIDQQSITFKFNYPQIFKSVVFKLDKNDNRFGYDDEQFNK